MWAALKRFFAPPVFVGDEDKTRSAQLLNTLLILVFVGVTIFAISVLLTLQNEMEPLVLAIAITLVVVTIVLYVLLRRGFVLAVGIMLALTLWVGFSIPMFSFAGIHDSAITGYFFIIAMVGVVAGWRSMLFFSGLTAIALIAAYYAEQVGYLVAVVPLPSKIDDLILVLLMVGSTALLLWYAVQRISGAYERLRLSSEALQLSNQDLAAARDMVESQSRELEQRTHYLATTALIAGEAAALLDTPETMMRRIVEIIADAFNYHLVSIFLIDDSGEWAELKAASSELGQRLIERNYRLRVGTGWAGEGIVGNVADSGRMRVVRDVTTDNVYVNTSELQGTVSEIAFPLSARGLVAGVLDIQSQRSETFADNEIKLLQGLINQVVMAIDNANLVKRLQDSANERQNAFGGISREVWKRILESEEKIVISDGQGTVFTDSKWQPEMRESAITGEMIPSENRAAVSFPIKSRDQVIGVIDAQLPAEEGDWTLDQLSLLEAISQQLGTALEAAQLYSDTQKRVVHETLTREVTDKMRNTVSWNDLLQTSLREISEMMGTSRAFVQFIPSNTQLTSDQNIDVEGVD